MYWSMPHLYNSDTASGVLSVLALALPAHCA